MRDQKSEARGERSEARAVSSKPTAGFALLITLTLLAFIVVMLIGLSMYTRIETAVAGNTQRQAQARENALLALNVALAQLQKYAGPDQRATATAEKFGGATGSQHYTGVWSTEAVSLDGRTPLTWLVSGNERSQADLNPEAPAGTMVPAPLAVTPESPGSRLQNLVGPNTTGDRMRSPSWVDAPLQDILATGVPGAAAGAPTSIGRYAWWVGDQGVKAPVAVPDTMASVNFPPFGDGTQQLDIGTRIRQQLPMGAGPVNVADGVPVFEPQDENNAMLVAGQKITTPNQLAFLRTSSNALVGLARLQQNFHTWSPNNFGVLANTKDGGLRVDLSLRTNALGSAYGAWSNYEAPNAIDMEPLAGSGVGTPQPIPAYDPANPTRRRYFNTRPVTGGGLEIGVHPVLAFFGISFSIRAPGNATNYEVSTRCTIGLWNPYTSALVPPAIDGQKLELRIEGLPTVTVTDTGGGGGDLDLQTTLAPAPGEPVKFALNWPQDGTAPHEASWLPGRIYYWAAESNTAEPNAMAYNTRDPDFLGKGVVRPTPLLRGVLPPPATVTRQVTVTANNETTIRVQLVHATWGVIATFESVKFLDFQTAAGALEANHEDNDFAYVFRLPDPLEIPENQTETWLAAAGRDPRLAFLPGSSFVSPTGGQPDMSTERTTQFKVSYPDRLLDRSTGSHSYNEDVPVFELPRAPVLSVGVLQHLPIAAARPFAVGNPWGNEVDVGGMKANQLFDRFFFSGLISGVTAGATPAGEIVLPNPLLKPLRKDDGLKLTTDDLRANANSGFTSKFLLQGAAFNLNSVNPAAWAAVLRGVRFATDATAFRYLDASFATGGTADDAFIPEPASDAARFFRFPQTAHEVFKADSPDSTALATYAASTVAAPAAPNPVSQANTHLFRRGMRTLSGTQVAALAAKIVELVGVKHAAPDLQGGPFRSLEEFLAPSTLFAVATPVAPNLTPNAPTPPSPLSASRSLLEAAIADTGINTEIPEFSSQFLTQGDIMTALAPILFPRSDTFVIRTYGEAVNPTKLPLAYRPGDAIPPEAIEGRAWAEAIVQRFPEYMERSMPAETPPAGFEPAIDPENPDLAPTTTEAQRINKLFGRRFKVVSFRWLTRADI